MYDDYGRGADGMLLPYVTHCYKAVVRPPAPWPTDRPHRTAPAPSRRRRRRRTTPTRCSSTSSRPAGWRPHGRWLRPAAPRHRAPTAPRSAPCTPPRSPPPPCATGLTAASRGAQRQAPARACSAHRRVALTDTAACSPGTAAAPHHAEQAAGPRRHVVDEAAHRGRPTRDLPCDDPGCRVRHAIVSARWSSRSGSSARCRCSPAGLRRLWSAPPTRWPGWVSGPARARRARRVAAPG